MIDIWTKDFPMATSEHVHGVEAQTRVAGMSFLPA